MEDGRALRIEKWLNGKSAPPWHMQLQPTSKCNLSCRFCWSRTYKRTEPDLSDDAWLNITNDACKMGIATLTIVGGGEPTIRSTLVTKMTKIIKDHKVHGTIVTNGTLITKELAEHLVRIGWDCVAISMHGGREKTDNFLRGNGRAFQMTLRSIDAINEFKNKHGSNKPNILFHSVITRQNVEELVDLFNLANEKKVGTFVIRLVNDNHEDPKYYITKDQYPILEENLKIITDMAPKFGIDLDWQMNLQDVRKTLFGEEKNTTKNNTLNENEPRKRLSCIRPFTEIVVIPDGTVGPCCAFCEGKYSSNKDYSDDVANFVDNIEKSNLSKIWTGEKFTKFRKLAFNGELPYYCKKTCPADYMFLEKSGKLLMK